MKMRNREMYSLLLVTWEYEKQLSNYCNEINEKDDIIESLKKESENKIASNANNGNNENNENNDNNDNNENNTITNNNEEQENKIKELLQTIEEISVYKKKCTEVLEEKKVKKKLKIEYIKY